MRRIRTLTAALVVMSAGTALAQAPTPNVDVRRNITYATHDGVALAGDLYIPKAAGKYPVVIAVHGGGWQAGSRANYRYWGQYLANQGIGLFSIDYRLSTPAAPSFPQAANDVRAAIQYVKHHAADLKADPDRLALMGDSAGGHLTALVGLAGDLPIFSKAYPNDPYAGISTRVKAVVPAYGVYDLVQQWQGDQERRPRDQIVEKFLGRAPMDDRKLFFDASPMSYAVKGPNHPQFMLTWGTADDVVDNDRQSAVFLNALKWAGITVRTAPVTGAVHFYMTEPIDDTESPAHVVAPKILRFLQGALAAADQ